LAAYPTTAALGNGLVPPDYTAPVWTYAQREARFGALNDAWEHGRGMKRRQRRELVTDEIARWRRALLDGATEWKLKGRQRVRLLNPWRVLMYARVVERSPAIYDLRAKIRVRLDALVRFGPWSGWGVEDPAYGKQRAHSYARYVVPKSSEKAWRWWWALARELSDLVKTLDGWWFHLCPASAAAADEAERKRGETPTEPVPAHHQDSTTGTAGGQQRSSTPAVEDQGQGYRDHVPVELQELLRRYPPRKGA
jgi:hypothetical protein